MKAINQIIPRITILGLCLCLLGCATAVRQPIAFDAAAFNPPISTTIYVMPIIDDRTDKRLALNGDDFTRMNRMTKDILEKDGYQTVFVNSWGAGSSVPSQNLAQMSAGELSKLAPANSKLFLVITINDGTKNYIGISSSYSISGTFTAIDQESGTVVWKDADTGREDSGLGLGVALMAQPFLAHDCQQMLLSKVFSSFPKIKQ